MQIRVITLRYNEALQRFPEDALRAVTFGWEELNFSKHFFNLFVDLLAEAKTELQTINTLTALRHFINQSVFFIRGNVLSVALVPLLGDSARYENAGSYRRFHGVTGDALKSLDANAA